MKKIVFLVCLIIVGVSFAQEEAGKKTYTEDEFQKALTKEVDEKMSRFRPQNIVSLSKEFMKRERELELKERELKKREEVLMASEKDLQKKLQDLKGQSDKLLGCLDDNDKTEKNRINHMVEVISGMRPQNAADVLSVQDVDISVKILGLLDPTKVSKIFNAMDKEISARLQKQFMNMKK